ncbi:uncharacterized protein ACB058_016652 [Synchiropus picturatus]
MSSPPLHCNQDSVLRFKKRKARFSFSEVHILLDEVRKNRTIVVGKFNRGIATDRKKRVWAQITARINEIGECQREVIEVVKKWSDLKCDTKRKVAAMRAGTVPNRGVNSRLSKDLNQTEKIVLQILEMADDEDDGRPTGDFEPLGDDDDVPDEEEMDEDDIIAMQSSPNGLDMACMPPPSSFTSTGPAHASNKDDQPNHSGSSRDSSQPPFDFQYELPFTDEAQGTFADSDDDQREEAFPSTQHKASGDHKGNNGVHKRRPASSGQSSAAAAAAAPSLQSVRDSVLQQALQSLQEQHATNMLLETVSRSLELLSESVQQLAETQQEFVRESLQIQRETVQVLRDFTGGAIALMHDKLNGRPTL